ncbi:hypothetical protein RCL1_002990 [Eukaryota sp. TZLM3-RCL]
MNRKVLLSSIAITVVCGLIVVKGLKHLIASLIDGVLVVVDPLSQSFCVGGDYTINSHLNVYQHFPDLFSSNQIIIQLKITRHRVFQPSSLVDVNLLSLILSDSTNLPQLSPSISPVITTLPFIPLLPIIPALECLKLAEKVKNEITGWLIVKNIKTFTPTIGSKIVVDELLSQNFELLDKDEITKFLAKFRVSLSYESMTTSRIVKVKSPYPRIIRDQVTVSVNQFVDVGQNDGCEFCAHVCVESISTAIVANVLILTVKKY